MCSIKLNEMVPVTQQDLHDLLEIFEKKSFEAVAFEEGTAVSCQFARKWLLWACDIHLGARARVLTVAN